MKSVNPVKMLAAFALALLVSSVTEGRILNKCELKAQLDAAQFQQITVMEETITVNSLITRLVCKASSSAFNTSFVKNTMVHNKEMKPSQAPPQAASQIPPKAPSSGAPPQAPAGAPSRRGPPQAPSSRLPPQAPAGAPPKPHAHAPTKGPQGSGHETQPNTATKVVRHLYGVFQLSDQWACDSGMNSSLNVCNTTCSALTDDDITDDIACLKTLMNITKAKPKEIPTAVKKIVEMMMVKECHSVVSPNYFADCV
ncbi:uncharacterized protein LOC107703730 [Sinocyclocheilus anshuiensis]|uniref:uncharacterized protein LOC107703730 n=1 Tax=Sinocyclocheilus anshuiensis TaxID=1608454 RepID=UPI0007B8EA89|nr:PREDICTED: uncharacterized protein LOC107703730 [Sinocyclocheilus anshuiensis]